MLIKDVETRICPFEHSVLPFTEGNRERFLCTALWETFALGPRKFIPVQNASVFSPQNFDVFSRFVAAFQTQMMCLFTSW